MIFIFVNVNVINNKIILNLCKFLEAHHDILWVKKQIKSRHISLLIFISIFLLILLQIISLICIKQAHLK